MKIKLGIVVVVIVSLVFIATQFVKKDSLGSVNTGNEYRALVIANNLQGTSGTLCSSSGTLGSVVITGAAASYLEFYDATTSNSSLRTTVATTSLTKIASIPVSATAQTFTFDVISPTGLIWEVSSATAKATTTVTYKCSTNV